MKKKKSETPEYSKVMETFYPFGSFELNRPYGMCPTAFNGEVRVVKYRVTVEIVEEPKEVIQQRIQKLWEECDNHHQWQPLVNKAKQFDYELVGGFGAKKKNQI